MRSESEITEALKVHISALKTLDKMILERPEEKEWRNARDLTITRIQDFYWVLELDPKSESWYRELLEETRKELDEILMKKLRVVEHLREAQGEGK